MNGDEGLKGTLLAPSEAKLQALGRVAMLLPRFSLAFLRELGNQLDSRVNPKPEPPRLRVVGLPETAPA